MSDLNKLPADLGDYTEQQEIAEFGKQIAGHIQEIGTKNMQKDGRDYRIMVYRVKISGHIPNEYEGEVHDISHNWAKKDNDEGKPIIYKWSQAKLGLYLLQTELGKTAQKDLLGRHVLFERHSISELPGYKPEMFKDLTAENQRLYPVKILD